MESASNVQVTNANPEAIELRVLVTAASVGDTSNFCAELREKLIVLELC